MPLGSIGCGLESTASIFLLAGFDGLGLTIGVAAVAEAAPATGTAVLLSGSADGGFGVVLVLVTRVSAGAGGRQVRALGEKAEAGTGATEEKDAGADGLGAVIGKRPSRMGKALSTGADAAVAEAEAAALALPSFVPAAAAAAAAAASVAFAFAYRFCVARSASHSFTLSICLTPSAGSLTTGDTKQRQAISNCIALTTSFRHSSVVADHVTPVGSLTSNGVTPSR